MPVAELLHTRPSADNLRAVEIKTESSRVQFELLRKSPLYHEGTGEWNNYFDDNKVHELFYTQNQLLGILVTGLFDPDSAKEQYHKLQQEELKTNNGLWISRRKD